jgi:mersacidin/lichenicidin family type 2 lantibiotic
MNVVGAWKDPEYRATLSEGELAALPPHPCGPVELGDDALARIVGAARTEAVATMGCCGGFTAQDTPCGSCNTCGWADTCAGTCDGQSTCGFCTA